MQQMAFAFIAFVLLIGSVTSDRRCRRCTAYGGKCKKHFDWSTLKEKTRCSCRDVNILAERLTEVFRDANGAAMQICDHDSGK